MTEDKEKSLNTTALKKLANTKKYFYAVGKRKTAIATVRLYTNGSGKIQVNDRELKEYFPTFACQKNVLSPLKQVGQEESVDTHVKVQGGGIKAQADSVLLAISRALIKLNPNFRKSLKKTGFLTRDARIKERKKPGLKTARVPVQWRKR